MYNAKLLMLLSKNSGDVYAKNVICTSAAVSEACRAAGSAPPTGGLLPLGLGLWVAVAPGTSAAAAFTAPALVASLPPSCGVSRLSQHTWEELR